MVKVKARTLLLLALPLTFLVITAGAFVRLSDAGLGCPDWPGCYGQLIGVAPEADAAAAYPQQPYDRKKAWIEVGHRYIAALLGLLILAAAFAEMRLPQRRFSVVLALPLLLAAQATLGMLTVTEKLKPVIVVSHLIGGMLILALIAAAVTSRPLSVRLETGAAGKTGAAARLRFWHAAAAAALFVQIVSGGWVSANYAGLACPDFPLCHGGFLPPAADFSGFLPGRELHQNSDGGAITAAALATIHWLHRLTAVVVAVVFALFAAALLRQGARGEALGLLLFLTAQIALGIFNVLWQLPLWAAVAHNAFAALLVVNIAVLGVKLRP